MVLKWPLRSPRTDLFASVEVYLEDGLEMATEFHLEDGLEMAIHL